MNNTLKQCTKCSEWKTPHMFSKCKTNYDGLDYKCKECNKEYHKRYYQENRDRIAEQHKQYYENNKDKILKRQKQNNKENKDKKAEYRKQYYNEHKDYYKEYRKQYREKNKDKLSEQNRQQYNKNKEYYKQWKEEHKEELSEYFKQYKKDHKEYYMGYYKQWREENPEYDKQYYEEHKDKKLEYGKQYQKEHLDVFRKKDRKYRSRKAELPFDFNEQDEQIALDYFNNCCAICGRSFENLSTKVCIAFDHWIPMSDKRIDNPGTVPWNMIPVCHGEGGCNNYKHNSDPEEWILKTYGKDRGQEIIDRIYIYFDWIKDNDNHR